MEVKEADEKLMIRYLLGEASEAEQEQVEEQYFRDKDFYLQLLALEDELICDYVHHQLAPRERERFEQCFLVLPRRRQKYESAKEQIHFLSSASLPATAQTSTPPLGERRSWLTRWLIPQPAFRMAAAAGLLVMILGGAWLIIGMARLRDRLNQSESARASLAQQAQEWQQQAEAARARNDELDAEIKRQRDELDQLRSQQPGPPSNLVSFELIAGLSRALGEAQKIVIPANANTVRLQLLFENHNYSTYRATLRTADGTEVQNWDKLTARPTKFGGVVTLRLPANLFTKRDYRLSLSGVTAAGELKSVGQYSFQVEKK